VVRGLFFLQRVSACHREALDGSWLGSRSLRSLVPISQGEVRAADFKASGYTGVKSQFWIWGGWVWPAGFAAWSLRNVRKHSVLHAGLADRPRKERTSESSLWPLDPLLECLLSTAFLFCSLPLQTPAAVLTKQNKDSVTITELNLLEHHTV
jgi:hypothetical protein